MALDSDPLEDVELTFLLGTAFQVLVAEFVRRLDAAGYSELRPAHGMIFQVLYDSNITSTELAERLGVTKQAAGQMVTELEKRGYLRRDTHPDGGRRRLLVLTDKAIDHMHVAGRVLRELEGELAASVGDGDLLILRSELSRLVRAMVGEAIPPLRPIW